MLLSGEQFTEIMAQLCSDRSAKTSEKRHEPRVGVRFEAMVTALIPGLPAAQQKISIRDLSKSGINILSHRQMSKGTQFMMKMVRADQRQVMALYRVCHSKPLGSTLYTVGAQLLSVSNADVRLAA